MTRSSRQPKFSSVIVTLAAVVLAYQAAAEQAPQPTYVSFTRGVAADQVIDQLGWPYVREATSGSAGTTEQLVYILPTKELGIFRFENDALVAYDSTPPKATARDATSPDITPADWERARKLLVVSVGASSIEVDRASPPDVVHFSPEATAKFPSWNIEKVWLYHLGDVSMAFGFSGDRVVKRYVVWLPGSAEQRLLADRRRVTEKEKQARTEKRKETAKRFMAGLGEVLGAAALGIMEAERARSEEQVVVISNGSAIVVPAGSAVAVGGGSVVQSRIDGKFEGWTGNTVFVLTNGQVWRQARYAYKYKYAYNPKVTSESRVDGLCTWTA
jgi:hypothetical protein